MFDAVTLAGVKVAQSGRAGAKIGKKKRESIDNPEYRQARGSFAWARRQQRMGKAIPVEAQAALNDLNNLAPFLIVRHRQGGQTPLMLPSYEKKDPRREITRRGLAKTTFNVMAAKMAAMRGQGRMSTRGTRYRVSRYQEKYGAESGAYIARLVNTLSYLEDAYPGITDQAIIKGTAALLRGVQRGAAAATAKANT